MSAIIFKINMASRVTGSNDEDIARDLLLPLVNNINFIAIDSEIDGWGTEIDKDDVSFNYKSAIEKAGDSEILRILTLLRVLSANSLTLNGLNDITNLSSSAIVAVFDTINHSHLLHRAIPSVFDEIMNSMKISSYITVKGEASETLDVKVHLSSSSEDIAYWSNEIEALGELYSALMDGASGSLDFRDIDIGGNGFKLYDYIGPIDKLNTFAKYKHAIVFNLLYQDDGSGNITGPLKYVRGSTNKAKANYIKNYFFSSAYAGDSTYLKAQCSAIDGLINAINDGFGSFDLEDTNDESNVDGIINLLNKLVLGTYADIQVSGGKVTFTRSYFAQEMVSGFISDFFVGTFSDMSSFFSTFFRGEVRSFNDFYNLNAVEINGIEGLLRLAAAFDISGGSRDNEAIKRAFALMGRNRNSFELESISSSNSNDEILRHHVEEKIYSRQAQLRRMNCPGEDDAARMERIYSLAVSYMENQKPFLSRQFRMDDLAMELGTNRTYLSHTINRMSGKGFPQFVNCYRVKYALELIESDPGIKVKDLAIMCGYNNAVTFSLAFETITGEPPGKYCQKISAEAALRDSSARIRKTAVKKRRTVSAETAPEAPSSSGEREQGCQVLSS